MKVLIACEYSGRVRDAFTKRGHFAMSCDILPTESPGPHYQGDIMHVLDGSWDMMIAFPPCTKLSKVGAAHWKRWQEDGSQAEAVEFFMALASAGIPKIAIENPAGIMSRMWRKPDQYVQPWWFGDPWIKTTGLWLKNLPKLTPTDTVEPRGYWVDGGSMTREKKWGERSPAERVGYKNRNNAARAHERSKTFQGLADAMAEQWG